MRKLSFLSVGVALFVIFASTIHASRGAFWETDFNDSKVGQLRSCTLAQIRNSSCSTEFYVFFQKIYRGVEHRGITPDHLTEDPAIRTGCHNSKNSMIHLMNKNNSYFEFPYITFRKQGIAHSAGDRDIVDEPKQRRVISKMFQAEAFKQNIKITDLDKVTSLYETLAEIRKILPTLPVLPTNISEGVDGYHDHLLRTQMYESSGSVNPADVKVDIDCAQQ